MLGQFVFWAQEQGNVPLLTAGFGSSFITLTSRAMMYQDWDVSRTSPSNKGSLHRFEGKKNGIYFLLMSQKEAWIPMETCEGLNSKTDWFWCVFAFGCNVGLFTYTSIDVDIRSFWIAWKYATEITRISWSYKFCWRTKLL